MVDACKDRYEIARLKLGSSRIAWRRSASLCKEVYCAKYPMTQEQEHEIHIMLVDLNAPRHIGLNK